MNRSIRVGSGFDTHRLVEDRPLILGGVRFDHPLGLEGHSDADVLTHAVCDALLGAACLGDLGRMFPDTDKRYRGISSLKLLAMVNDRITGDGWGVINIDVTVVAQAPEIAPHSNTMRDNIAWAVGGSPGQVSIKATTTERLGFTGRGEGIGAWAVALIGKIAP